MIKNQWQQFVDFNKRNPAYLIVTLALAITSAVLWGLLLPETLETIAHMITCFVIVFWYPTK